MCRNWMHCEKMRKQEACPKRDRLPLLYLGSSPIRFERRWRKIDFLGWPLKNRNRVSAERIAYQMYLTIVYFLADFGMGSSYCALKRNPLCQETEEHSNSIEKAQDCKIILPVTIGSEKDQSTNA